MKMSVHALGLIGIFFAQAKIIQGFPFAGTGFQIAIAFSIESVFFDETIQVRSQ